MRKKLIALAEETASRRIAIRVSERDVVWSRHQPRHWERGSAATATQGAAGSRRFLSRVRYDLPRLGRLDGLDVVSPRVPSPDRPALARLGANFDCRLWTSSRRSRGGRAPRVLGAIVRSWNPTSTYRGRCARARCCDLDRHRRSLDPRPAAGPRSVAGLLRPRRAGSSCARHMARRVGDVTPAHDASAAALRIRTYADCGSPRSVRGCSYAATARDVPRLLLPKVYLQPRLSFRRDLHPLRARGSDTYRALRTTCASAEESR